MNEMSLNKKTAKKAKPVKEKKPSIPKIDSPYLAAQQVWNERYGSYIKSRNQWRLIAFLSLGLSIPAVAYSLMQSGKTKVIPYVVEVDGKGSVVGGGPVSASVFQAENVIKANISRFIKNFRGVTVDSYLQRQRIDDVYSFLPAQSRASVKLNSYFRADGNPFERAKEVTVAVNIVAVVRLTEESYRAEWVEVTYGRNGQEQERERWQAIVTFELIPPEGAQIITNPLGVYVKDIEWEKETL